MNRRGFLGLLGNLVTVGAAISVHPAILAPLKAIVPQKKLTDAEVREEIRKMNAWVQSQSVQVWMLAS
jgi:hypothetical protein